jgi:osmotically-inducible protein OsmY
VSNGYVVLEGAATWMYQKEAAESAVAYLPGVLGVDNRIVLHPVASTMDVKARIDAALARAANLDSRDIVVSASDGVVRLTGSVQSYVEREDAERAAWGAPGVRRVDNAISVHPHAH